MSRFSWKGLGVAALAAAGACGLLMGIVGAAQLCLEKSRELAETRERVLHLRQWLKVKEQVALHQREALGPLVSSPDLEDAQWLWLSGLQEAARVHGLSVQELRPAEIQSGPKREGTLRLDVKVEGNLGQVGGFLTQLPDRVPGVCLEKLQIIPQGDGRGQCILRLNFQPLSDR